MRGLLKTTNSIDWVYFGVRWLLLIGISVLIFIMQGRVLVDFDSIRDIVTAVAYGAAATLVLGIVIAVPQLRVAVPFIATLGDWIIAYAFASLAISNLMLMTGIALAIAVCGLLRLGALWGLVHASGVLAATIIALGTSPLVGFDALMFNHMDYMPGVLVFVLLVVLLAIWSNALDEENGRKKHRIKETLDEQQRRLDRMRERVRAVTEMSSALNASLQYEKVLDAALNVGRLGLRDNPRQRLVSLVLLVESANELRIATSRGLSHLDEHRSFRGTQGIIARTLEAGKPLISEDGEHDPELGRLVAFKNIRSVLSIPLQAGYDSYGVLVFGSSMPNAFNETHIDTLRVIGVQTTIALQNAALYTSLMEEKERIISIEESARKALVRDLHDVPTQTVSAVTMRLGIIPGLMKKAPHEVLGEIEEIRELAQRATDEIRHVMFTLRPLALETQGLAAALDQLAEKMMKTYKQRVVIQMEENVDYYIEGKAEGTLFYLIEEAVNNARKYAGAPVIHVNIKRENGSVVVRVIDNGKGFDTNAVDNNYESRGSFGMVNMRERAELVGGLFDLKSTPGVGTTVTVTIPAAKRDLPPPSNHGKKSNREPLTPRKRPATKERVRTGPLSPSR